MTAESRVGWIAEGSSVTQKLSSGPWTQRRRGVAMGHFDGKGNYSRADHVVAGGSPRRRNVATAITLRRIQKSALAWIPSRQRFSMESNSVRMRVEVGGLRRRF